MSRHRTPGRRRAPGAVRRLPDGLSRLGATWAVKTVATVGVLGGAAVALALPVDASPAALTLSVPVATSSAARSDGLAASRSSVRAAAVPATPAVSAPDGAAPFAPESVGVAGVKAVAKPAPKPAAKVSGSGSGSAAAAPSQSYATGISARCGNLGLIPNAARVCTAVDSVFHLANIGGYRPNAGEHSTGQATDFMISSQSQGDAIAAFVQAHAAELNVKYIIWRQRYWEPGSDWKLMEDRGSPTANHMDHVHVTANY